MASLNLAVSPADFGTRNADGSPGNDELHHLTGDDRITTRDGIGGKDQANGGGGTNSCTLDIGDLVSNC